MTQPPYPPAEPEQPGQPYSYPPPADPFATGTQPVTPPVPGQQPYPVPQPYAPPPTSGPPAWPPTQGYPISPPPAYPISPPAYPTSPPPVYDPATGGYLPVPPVAPPPKKRRGLMITAIVLGVALLFCGGGGSAAWYYLVRNADGQGKESPTVAVNDFLVAVFTDQDPLAAEELVCAAARDRKAITAKVDQIKGQANGYKQPKFSWQPPTVLEENASRDSARVAVKIRVTTTDERVAEQPLEIVTIKKSGWFVCDVRSTG